MSIIYLFNFEIFFAKITYYAGWRSAAVVLLKFIYCDNASRLYQDF